MTIPTIMKSWRWIKKSKLDNNKKAVHIIYQLEEILFLITTSFLGIWLLEVYILYYGRSGDVFGIIFGVISDLFGKSVLSISTNMFYRELIIIGIPTVLFLIILNVNDNLMSEIH
ncbi:unnamed protein product [Rhizophagus irregularis]|nr:unnamed protein product [Rhizophagus irregularis]